MAIPTVTVYLGAAFNPATADIWDEPSSWTNIAPYWREASWQRGRQGDLDEIAAGTGRLVLRNSARTFDPTWEDGPYFPLADRQVKIEATINAVTYSLFRGWTVNWKIIWGQSRPNWSEVHVTLEDAIGLLSRWPDSTHPTAQTVSARIDATLTNVGFPAGMRSLTGGTTVATKATTDGTRWGHIQECVRSDKELNVCYFDGRGYAIFGPPVDTTVVFGDAGGSELKYVSNEMDYGMDLVFSRVVVTRQGGTPQVKSGDATHGQRNHERSTLHLTDADALVMANNILSNYAEPKPRPAPIVVRPGNTTLLWEQVLGLELEDTITLKRSPPGGGDRFDQPMTIVGMEHHTSDTAVDWTATYHLAGRSVLFPASGSARPLDTFSRANEGPPMTGWTTYESGLKVLTLQCAPNDTGTNSAYWTTPMTSRDQEAYVTIATHPAVGGQSAVMARMNPAGGGTYGDGYAVAHFPSGGTDSVAIQRYDNGTPTILTSVSVEVPAGDGIGIRCRGSSIEAWVRISNVWSKVASVTDATYIGAAQQNKLGLFNDGGAVSTVARYDNFGGGPA